MSAENPKLDRPLYDPNSQKNARENASGILGMLGEMGYIIDPSGAIDEKREIGWIDIEEDMDKLFNTVLDVESGWENKFNTEFVSQKDMNEAKKEISLAGYAISQKGELSGNETQRRKFSVVIKLFSDYLRPKREKLERIYDVLMDK